MVPKSYCVAINFRDGDRSLVEELPQGFSWPIGWLTRHVLEDDKSDRSYETALQAFTTTRIMSPCYIILSGIGSQAALITRDELHEYRRLEMGNHIPTRSTTRPVIEDSKTASSNPNIHNTRSKKKTKKKQNKATESDATKFDQQSTLIQANMDHWLSSPEHDLMDSISRVRLAARALRHSQSAKRGDAIGLVKLLCQEPIWDFDTIYATVMSATSQCYVSFRDVEQGLAMKKLKPK
jgi:hypothetical protein